MEILDYAITHSFIHVEYSESDFDLSVAGVVIDKEKFELFLRMNNKLDYVIDYNECGEHKQSTGTISIDEYYEHGETIVADLIEYIKLKTLSKQ